MRHQIQRPEPGAFIKNSSNIFVTSATSQATPVQEWTNSPTFNLLSTEYDDMDQPNDANYNLFGSAEKLLHQDKHHPLDKICDELELCVKSQ